MDKNSVYDYQAGEVMRRILKNDSVCVDIGSHVGSFMDQFLRWAPNGQHWAFEPLPDLCENLRRKYADRHNVTVVEAALSDREGTSQFTRVVTNPGYSGLRERRYDREEQLQEIIVPVRQLDDVLPTNLVVDLIKIDVEGGELEVLRGSVRTIRRSRPIVIFEHGLGAADCYGTKPIEVYDVLCCDLGLGIHLMERWLENQTALPLSPKEFTDEFESGRNFFFMAIA